jgi:iron complex transport system ATP-binding protein
MLEGTKLTYAICGHRLLNAASISIHPGEVVAIVGANGAGKSTLLKVLSGDLNPSQGSVCLNGKPLARWTVRQRAQQRAVLPQSINLTFGFTALEVALMGRTPHLRGTERPHDYAVVRDALSMTGALHLENRPYTTLSGGEAQRVQLARALAQIWDGDHPRYLLLDEPTSNLDLAHQHTTMQVARVFAERGVGVLAILHDLNLAAQYADRLIVMSRGCILAAGEPVQVLQPALVEEAFAMEVLVNAHPQSKRPYILPVSPNQ